MHLPKEGNYPLKGSNVSNANKGNKDLIQPPSKVSEARWVRKNAGETSEKPTTIP
ncbi:hypothetical protein Sjap_020643 [Stephania japonica]|uniref:Uncharacterized protein n=1 Tax=Stephania japonica TaxID=461633 RepID=A0AAP0FA09_9MAGN